MKSLAEKLNSLLESVEDPKILAAREKLAKMQKTLERHHTRLAKKESEITKLTDKNDIYWCQCDIDHLKDDIKRTEKKISDYQAYLDKIESKTQSEKNKREEFPEICSVCFFLPAAGGRADRTKQKPPERTECEAQPVL